MSKFEENNQELLSLMAEWEPKLLGISEASVTCKRNAQNRSVKQLLGHMVDSATNNTHRMIHLQYQPSPLIYPDYASLGNNDRWIALQNYQAEDWDDLIQLWKYSNLHLVHVIRHVDQSKLGNQWISALNQSVSLREMILDYPRHFKLHLAEISALLCEPGG